MEGVDAMQHLPYLHGVIKEGLRLAPVNSRLPRVVPSSGWTFREHYLPPGTVVGVSAPQLFFNPKVFLDPMKFEPERWAKPSAEMLRDFVPFSVGSRQCLAKNLATAELGMAVMRLADEDVLRGATAAQGERIVFHEWFNTAIKGNRVDVWWEVGE